jgi:hypothetical protein
MMRWLSGSKQQFAKLSSVIIRMGSNPILIGFSFISLLMETSTRMCLCWFKTRKMNEFNQF